MDVALMVHQAATCPRPKCWPAIRQSRALSRSNHQPGQDRALDLSRSSPSRLPLRLIPGGLHRGSRGLDGADDVDVAGADAEVAGESLADGGLVGVGLVAQQLERGDQDAGRAVAALEAVVLPERLMERVQT